jgi:hypothetical protein
MDYRGSYRHLARNSRGALLTRDDLCEKVATLMRTLVMDQAPAGHKSSLELLTDAHVAFTQPSDPNASATGLIPLRSCMDSVLDMLLKRRPTQEEAGSNEDKVLSICRQLTSDPFTAEQGPTLASEWSGLKIELSRAKDGRE